MGSHTRTLTQTNSLTICNNWPLCTHTHTHAHRLTHTGNTHNNSRRTSLWQLKCNDSSRALRTLRIICQDCARTQFPNMHQWSISKPQGVCAQQGGSTQRTSQDQSPRWRRGLRLPCLCLPAGARLWAWLLLGLLTLVPGAWSFLSEEQEELLVELHNHYRGQVSPSASAMLPLVRRHLFIPCVSTRLDHLL